MNNDENNINRWERRLRKSKETIQKWLDNFQPDELPYMKKLLDNFRFYAQDEVSQICQQLYIKLLEDIQIPLSKWVFISIGGEAKSDKFIAYWFRINNHLSEEQFINKLDPSLNSFQNKVIIYLDDISSSGKQFSDDWDELIKSLGSAFIDKNNFIFAPLFISEDAVNRINMHIKHENFSLIFLENHLLKKNTCAYCIESGIFKGNEIEKAKEILKKYGEKLYPKGPLGYGKAGLLIAFFYNTPSNTLPIFWQKSNDIYFNFIPLFPRKESIKIDIKEIAEEKDKASKYYEKRTDIGLLDVKLVENLRKVYYNFYNNYKSFEKSSSIIIEFLIQFSEEFNKSYEIKDVLGLGGSGLVFLILDIRLFQYRVLKIPHPNFIEVAKIHSIKLESEIFFHLHHKNLINYHSIGSLYLKKSKQDYPFLVFEYLEQVMDLEMKIENILNLSNSNLLEVMKIIITISDQVANAICYLHDKDIFLISFEPETISIDQQNRVYLIGLEYSIVLDFPKTYAFTPYYAHPALLPNLEPENGIKTKLIFSKSNDYIKYDMFSFGKIILKMLSKVYRKFGDDACQSSYLFSYLHLMSCRMLDSYNKEKLEEDLSELWGNLTIEEIKQIIYCNFKEILIDFEKIDNHNYIFRNIPELSEIVSDNTIIIDPLFGNILISSRVAKFFNLKLFFHQPMLFSNLGFITPLVRDSQLTHIIRAFHICREVIKSLINDDINPLFKQVFNKKDLETILFLSLIHDIDKFLLLNYFNSTLFDNFNQELAKKLLQTEPLITYIQKGWGLDVNSIIDIIFNRNELNIKKNILSSIYKGILNIDYFSQLISQSSHLQHINVKNIIFKQIFANLTIITQDNHHFIGVKTNGKMALESLLYSEYHLVKLYYNKENERARICMLRKSFNPLFKMDILPFLNQLKNYKTLFTQNIFEFFSKIIDKELFNMVITGNFFKPILEISPIHNQILWDKCFNSLPKIIKELDDIENKIQESIVEQIISQKFNILNEKISREEKFIIFDIYDNPKRYSQPFFKQLNIQISPIFSKLYKELISTYSIFRIYCNPNTYDLLKSSFSEKQLISILEKAI